jgi:hypothetical protein
VISTRIKSRILPFLAALAVAVVPGSALAHGGHGGGGGGHGGGHAGGHFGGGTVVGGAHFGGRYGGHLYVGPVGVWGGGAHWGNGFWVWGGTGWVRYPNLWWVSPAYPGWVWVGQPWLWDGEQWVDQGGYWTTADVPQPGLDERAVDGPPIEAPIDE